MKQGVVYEGGARARTDLTRPWGANQACFFSMFFEINSMKIRCFSTKFRSGFDKLLTDSSKYINCIPYFSVLYYIFQVV